MKMSELLAHRGLRDELAKHAPLSIYSGNPLSLTSDELCLWWENCLEADWWVGQQDGIFTRQDRRQVTDEEIIAAAERAGLNHAEVAAAFVSRLSERAELDDAAAAHAMKYSKESAAQREAEARASRQRQAERHPELLDPTLAAAAEKEMADLFAAHPRIARMTRTGVLLDPEERPLAQFTQIAAMKAWLFQHGHRASVDDREHFLAAQK